MGNIKQEQRLYSIFCKKQVYLIRGGLYVPESIAGDKNPSHYILNVYALNENIYSSMKEFLLKTKPKEYFRGLREALHDEIYKHYMLAEDQGCKDVVWSNEGLYLLNSIQEYGRLRELFDKYSSGITCVCCFRDVDSYKKSYAQQQAKQGISPSDNVDSYRYLQHDSWLFDYPGKIKILKEVFDEVITFPFDQQDNVRPFMEKIGYPIHNAESIRLNVTKFN